MKDSELIALALEALNAESHDDVLAVQSKFFDAMPESGFGDGVQSFEALDALMGALRRISDARSALFDGQTLVENVARAGGGPEGLMAVLDETIARTTTALRDGEDVVERQDDALGSSARKWAGRLVPGFLKRPPRADTPDPFTPFSIDQKDNEPWRWTMIVGHNGQDRESEWLTADGFDLNCKAINATGHFPEAWVAHVPGSRWGLADFADWIDGTYVVSGVVDDNPVAQATAIELAKKSAELGVSHSYAIIEQVGPEIRKFFDYEVSPLPRSVAALPETGIHIGAKGAAMVTEQQKANLVATLGTELADKIVDGVGTVNSLVDGAGIARKDADPTPEQAAVTAAEANLETARKALEEANAHNTPTGQAPAPPETPPAPPADPPQDAQPPVTEGSKELTEERVVDLIKEAVGPIGVVLGEISTGMKELAQSKDAVVADAIRNSGPAFVASKHDATVTPGAQDQAGQPGSTEPVREVNDVGGWMTDQLFGGQGAPGPEAQPVTG